LPLSRARDNGKKINGRKRHIACCPALKMPTMASLWMPTW